MLLREVSTQSISEHFLAPILFDFKAEFKNIEIRSKTQNSKECLNLLKNGNIKFAIIEAELDPALVEYENLEINFWQDDELFEKIFKS